MIEPNRLSNPAENAALARAGAVADRLDQVRVERFVPSHLAMLEPHEHAALLRELEAEADRCGRRDLLDGVRARVGDQLVARFTPLAYRGMIAYPVGLASTARPEDEAAVISAVRDAVSVALLEDRLDADTAARLAEPGRALLGLPPLHRGSWAREADADGRGDAAADAAAEAEVIPEQKPGGPGAPPGVPEPSASDWTEAAVGDARVGGYEPFPVGLRVALATILACTAGPAAVFVGVAIGQTGAGLLAGLAIVAVCWLAATYHR